MARKKTLPPGWQGTGHHPATPQQIKAIHSLRGQLHMADESYVDLIARHGLGVMSSKDLTRNQASKVIAEMIAKLPGATPQPSTKTSKKTEPVTTRGNVVAFATPPQKILIGHLTREIDWYRHSSFEAWLEKNMGLSKVVTKEEASRVIEGLKGLKKHGHASAAARS
jgi:hypothetical protein